MIGKKRVAVEKRMPNGVLLFGLGVRDCVYVWSQWRNQDFVFGGLNKFMFVYEM